MTLKRYIAAEHTSKVSFKILPEARQVLELAAEQEGVSVSTIIRQALRAQLGERYPAARNAFEEPVVAS